MSEDANKPTVSNPKPDDQKHYENTSEYSKPHTSEAEPSEHVDSMAFGKDGERDKANDTHHITDEGAKEMGQQTYDMHQENKK